MTVQSDKSKQLPWTFGNWLQGFCAYTGVLFYERFHDLGHPSFVIWILSRVPTKSMRVSAGFTMTLNFDKKWRHAKSFVLIVRMEACDCYSCAPTGCRPFSFRPTLLLECRLSPKKVFAGFLMRATVGANLSRSAHFVEELIQSSYALRGINSHLPSLGPGLTFLSLH